MSYNDEPQAGGLIHPWKWILIPIIIVITIFIFSNYIWNPMVSGTKRWETYTGVLLSFDIDCDQCCHPSSGFSMNTSSGIVHESIGNCDENLEHLVHVGSTYTIRLEPYAEPYAVSRKLGEPNSFWHIQIDWIKNVNGDVIYGNEWF
jgi:hypothetical protein